MEEVADVPDAMAGDVGDLFVAVARLESEGDDIALVVGELVDQSEQLSGVIAGLGGGVGPGVGVGRRGGVIE